MSLTESNQADMLAESRKISHAMNDFFT